MMSSILNIFILTSLCILRCHCIPKSISLTPGNPSSNGVTTKLIKGATNYAPFEWDLYAIDEIQFNMKLHLDKSWSFHPNYTTTLTFEIGSDTATDSILPTSLIVSFSQNNAKYITSVIEIGQNNDDILIYPPPFDGKQLYGQGNIEQLVSEDMDKDNRINKASNNGSYDYFDTKITYPNISYPFTFQIENHPDFDYMIFTYFTPYIEPRNIIYFGMDTNNTLDIFLSAGNAGDNFDITYFNLIHSISATANMFTTANNIFTTTQTPEIRVNNSHSSKYNSDWFQSALVVILIGTVLILCCLFIVFGIMFFKIFRNHRQLEIIQITAPKHAMKNDEAMHYNVPSYSTQLQTNQSKSMTSITNSPNSNIPTLTAAPTLNDILAVLTAKSISFADLQANKDDAFVNDAELNTIYTDVMRANNMNNMNNMNRDRKGSKSGEVLHEMEEKHSDNENESDMDIELGFTKNRYIPGVAPGAGHNNNNNNNNANDKLAIDENVNKISFVDKMNRLKLQMQDMISGDSELMYENGNEIQIEYEGTPFGSSDTNAGITPYRYTPEIPPPNNMANV